MSFTQSNSWCFVLEFKNDCQPADTSKKYIKNITSLHWGSPPSSKSGIKNKNILPCCNLHQNLLCSITINGPTTFPELILFFYTCVCTIFWLYRSLLLIFQLPRCNSTTFWCCILLNISSSIGTILKCHHCLSRADTKSLHCSEVN